MKKIERIELLDFNNPDELQFAIDFVGKSLKSGPPLSRVVISDDSLEGKKLISDFLEKGWKIESIKN